MTETSQEATSQSGNGQQKIIDLTELKKLRQLYASLLGVIAAKTHSKESHVRKKPVAAMVAQWKNGHSGTFDVADSLM